MLELLPLSSFSRSFFFRFFCFFLLYFSFSFFFFSFFSFSLSFSSSASSFSSASFFRLFCCFFPLLLIRLFHPIISSFPLLLLLSSPPQRASKPAPSPVKVKLESGSLLMMNPPTNDFWYHALPKRSLASAPDARINMTFRQMILMKR